MTQGPAPRPRVTGAGLPSISKGLSTGEALLGLWQRRGSIFAITLGSGLLAAVISLLLPNKYTASTSILPETQASTAAANLAQLASSFGINVGRPTGRLTDLYPTMITSERILRPVLYQRLPLRAGTEDTTLLQFLRLPKLDSAAAYDRGLRRVRETVLEVAVDRRTSIISLSVTLRDPVLAANVANAITAQLDTFVRHFQQTQASDQVLWIETRLSQVQEDLRQSEEELKSFRERNRFIANSPELQLKEGRLTRDVTTNTTVFVELKRQLELAKIDAIKNIPIVRVLDIANPPSRHSSPRRQVIVIGTMLVTLLGAIFVVVGLERLKAEPESSNALFLYQVGANLAARWARFRLRIRSGSSVPNAHSAGSDSR